jgi:hypothetical protein
MGDGAAAAVPAAIVGVLLGLGCGNPYTSFVAGVDNKTGATREVTITSREESRRSQLVADVAPGGSARLEARGNPYELRVMAEVAGVPPFPLTEQTPMVELWDRGPTWYLAPRRLEERP